MKKFFRGLTNPKSASIMAKIAIGCIQLFIAILVVALVANIINVIANLFKP